MKIEDKDIKLDELTLTTTGGRGTAQSDWHRIKAAFDIKVNTRNALLKRTARREYTAEDCKIQYEQWGSPMVNQTKWSKDEEKLLLKLLADQKKGVLVVGLAGCFPRTVSALPPPHTHAVLCWLFVFRC